MEFSVNSNIDRGDSAIDGINVRISETGDIVRVGSEPIIRHMAYVSYVGARAEFTNLQTIVRDPTADMPEWFVKRPA